MKFDELIAGPQMIGLIWLIVGWVMIKYPSKDINNGYGYRTNASMKNQQTWDEANRFSARLMVKHGAVLVLTGLVVGIAYQNSIIPKSIENGLRPLLMIGPIILSAILLIVTTEKHLKRTFSQ
ncbi:SdpI family protein [Mucilaginibacter sp.]|uniref:SdpI family protein n=1 Tax=Mucilaginibacter sp. TaxID=1882438 RepID=UPI0026275E43|nr:SdpI family protein [Mucilaginibacter sp.]MDB4926109.1 SdpI/YhfL protein family [Mucilaginibacter sp.]